MSAEDQIRAKLRELAEHIKGELSPGFIFALLVASTGEGGTMLYVANAQRPDVLQMMREFVAVNMEERNWQREMPDLEIEQEFDQWWEAQAKRKGSRLPDKEWCQDAFMAGRATA